MTVVSVARPRVLRIPLERTPEYLLLKWWGFRKRNVGRRWEIETMDSYLHRHVPHPEEREALERARDYVNNRYIYDA